jgi:hypothetical protein
MSHDAPGPRPRQVTVGGWVVAVASALLVVTVFDATTHLHSVETRDAVTDALTTDWKGLGLSVDDALAVIRWALLVAGVAAAATGVLGVFVLQRHVAARVALTVAAVPLVLSAPIGGSGRSGSAAAVFLLGAVVAAGTALLWTEPARDWFAGRSPRAAAPGATAAVPARRGVAMPTSAPPRAAHRAGPMVRPADATRMPVELRVACVLTWAFSAVTAVGYLLVIAALAVDRVGVVDVARDNAGISDATVSDNQLVGIVLAVSSLFLVWCVLASLLAALCWRRHAWASVALLVSCGMATVFAAVAVPYSALHVGASMAAFVLLLRPSVRAWFRRSGSPVW